MGNVLSAQIPNQILPVEAYLSDISDVEFVKRLFFEKKSVFDPIFPKYCCIIPQLSVIRKKRKKTPLKCNRFIINILVVDAKVKGGGVISKISHQKLEYKPANL